MLTANTVPYAELPPYAAVPYRVLPDKINPAYGLAPSLLGEKKPEVAVKLYRFVKPVPSVLTANTVPLAELPPRDAVPYKVLPDKIKLACGLAPSLLLPVEGSIPVKLCNVINPVPSVLTANTMPLPFVP